MLEEDLIWLMKCILSGLRRDDAMHTMQLSKTYYKHGGVVLDEVCCAMGMYIGHTAKA